MYILQTSADVDANLNYYLPRRLTVTAYTTQVFRGCIQHFWILSCSPTEAIYILVSAMLSIGQGGDKLHDAHALLLENTFGQCS